MKGGKGVHRRNRTLGSLVGLIALAGALGLLGCSEAIQQTIESDVKNQSFTFPSGAVFNPALANVSTTLSFADNASTFTLSSAGGRATGTNIFGSCTLTVTTSTYAIGAGPQVNDALKFDPCDFDIPNKTLLLGNGTITATSLSAVPATPSS